MAVLHLGGAHAPSTFPVEVGGPAEEDSTAHGTQGGQIVKSWFGQENAKPSKRNDRADDNLQTASDTLRAGQTFANVRQKTQNCVWHCARTHTNKHSSQLTYPSTSMAMEWSGMSISIE